MQQVDTTYFPIFVMMILALGFVVTVMVLTHIIVPKFSPKFKSKVKSELIKLLNKDEDFVESAYLYLQYQQLW